MNLLCKVSNFFHTSITLSKWEWYFGPKKNKPQFIDHYILQISKCRGSRLSYLCGCVEYILKNFLNFVTPLHKFSFLFSSYKIMQDCWQENPDDRPMFENLRNDLKEMENQHQVKYLHHKFKQGLVTSWCRSHLIDFLFIFFLAEAHQYETLWQHPLRRHGLSSCSRVVETTLITIGGNSFSHILFENRLFKLVVS